MFQFTTTNVINSDKDLTTGEALWTTEKDVFSVKRVANFKKENISAVYKRKAADAEMAKITINLNGKGNQGDTLRLAIYLGLTQASQDSRYSNDLIYKGKLFSVDFVVANSAENTATKLVKTINKYSVLVYGEKLLKATSNGNYLTIEATTEYQRFRKLTIDKYEDDTTKYPYSGHYKTLFDLNDWITNNTNIKNTNAEVTDSEEGYFEGKEGFGTYSYLLHNLRLPTSMRTRAFGVNQDETPVVGALYNQYTIHYCVNRGVLGTNAVGDTVKSVTTHVFFVNQDLTDFEKKLETIAPITEVTGHTADPVDPVVAAAKNAADATVTAAIKKLKQDNSLN